MAMTNKERTEFWNSLINKKIGKVTVIRAATPEEEKKF